MGSIMHKGNNPSAWNRLAGFLCAVMNKRSRLMQQQPVIVT
jgi:hypothetical protein